MAKGDKKTLRIDENTTIGSGVDDENVETVGAFQHGEEIPLVQDDENVDTETGIVLDTEPEIELPALSTPYDKLNPGSGGSYRLVDDVLVKKEGK